MFWLGAALIATLLYRKRSDNDNEENNHQAADEFENLAVQILNKFYQASPPTCAKAIIRQIPAYGNVTWLGLAVAAEAKQFIAQKAVQDVLNNIWFVENFILKIEIEELFHLGMVLSVKRLLLDESSFRH